MCILASCRDWQACVCRQNSWCWGHDIHAVPRVNFWLAPVWLQGLRAHLRLCLGCASAMDLPKAQLLCPKPAPRGEAKLAKLGQLGDVPQKCTPNPAQTFTLYVHIYTRRLWCGLHKYSGRPQWMQGRRSPPHSSYCVLAKGFLLHCRIIFGQWQLINEAKSIRKSGGTRRVRGKQKQTPNQLQDFLYIQ